MWGGRGVVAGFLEGNSTKGLVFACPLLASRKKCKNAEKVQKNVGRDTASEKGAKKNPDEIPFGKKIRKNRRDEILVGEACTKK